MRWILSTLALVAGCTKTDPLYCKDHVEDTARCGEHDEIDAAIDADLHVNCFGPPGPFEVCLGPETLPTATVQIPNTFDTTADPLCRPTQPAGWENNPACFIVARSITSATTQMQIVGTRPLVLVAIDDITIDHPLFVGSQRVGTAGPGATNTPCNGGSDGTLGTGTNVGGGGGAGGSFQTRGGNGGAGDVTGPSLGSAGISNPTIPPAQLRAGCPGTKGALPGTPGLGGGAVYLLAGTSISITSSLNASGAAGGEGNSGNSGGSGGGSGGMIALFAPTITATGPIFANGGGGATGADGGSFHGLPGTDPSQPLTPASGGSGGNGGAGGAGFAGVVPTGNAMPGISPNSSTRGGGGGGGGGGYILAPNTATLGTQVSPPARQF